MKIEVLGTGCYKCIKLESLIDEVLKELGRTNVEVVRISDEREILRHMPLDEIPGLLIDGMLVCTGRVPGRELLTQWLSGVVLPHAG